MVGAEDGGSRESKRGREERSGKGEGQRERERERERERGKELLIHPLSVMLSSLFPPIQESH